MGPRGVYQTFAAGRTPIGGMMNRTSGMSSPQWLFYFNVDGVDAAAERMKNGGGEVLMGPHQVPGGSWILNGADPQGGVFALVGSNR